MTQPVNITYNWSSSWSYKAAKPARRIRAIAEEVAARHGYEVKDLIGPSRYKRLCAARFEAMWLARRERRADGLYLYSMPQIGRFFGGRDHTTVLNAIRRHEERMREGLAKAA